MNPHSLVRAKEFADKIFLMAEKERISIHVFYEALDMARGKAEERSYVGNKECYCGEQENAGQI